MHRIFKSLVTNPEKGDRLVMQSNIWYEKFKTITQLDGLRSLKAECMTTHICIYMYISIQMTYLDKSHVGKWRSQKLDSVISNEFRITGKSCWT